ncbi:MAG: hypothetical protein HXY50_07070 [Ignavibacteriaceae bacterium]|nr:hypothetical protein [Ignavibacteriaceae bacterium]
MNKLSDELLNRYIDGDLDSAAQKEVADILTDSFEDRSRYQLLLTVHEQLKKTQEEFISDTFTDRVMKKVFARKKAQKEQRNFILAVSSIFVFFFLIIIGVVVFTAFNSHVESHYTQNYTHDFISLLKNVGSKILLIFSPKGISIFGSILSLGILITGYFFFENLKSSRLKDNGVH